MPAQTSRLRLLYHTLADAFRIQDYADNWQILNDNPGIFLCTSVTRPSDWTSFDDGRLIFETDTRLLWVYDHADSQSFKRTSSFGYLGGNSDTNQNTSSDTYVTIVSDTVDVAGDRPVQITVSGSIDLVSSPAQLRIYDGASALLEWNVSPKVRAFTLTVSASAGSYDLSIGAEDRTLAFDDDEVAILAALNTIPGFVGNVYPNGGDFIIQYSGHLPILVDDAGLTGTATSTPLGIPLPTELVAASFIDLPAAGSVTYSFQARRAETSGSVDFDVINIDIVEL